MEAVAHNPAFAKKVGIPQSVGKDFSVADKGKKFGRGGSIDKQNTQRGSMDMPFKSLKKFGGMKSGGKVKRYAGEDESLVETDVETEKSTVTEKPSESLDKMTFSKAFREKLNELGEGKTFMWRGKSYSTDLAKPSNPISKSTPTAKAIPSNENNASAVTGRTSPISKKMVGEDAMGNRRTQAQEDAYVSSLSKKPESKMSPSLNYAPMRRGMKFGGSVKESKMGMKKGGMPPAAMAAMMARRPRMGAGMPPSAPPVMPPQPPMGMKKGGMAGSMHKMPGGKMMKNSAMNMGGMAGMKKGGMPMKDGKPAFMMGKKKMMGGGMAGYAKGGGIESSGKTKGTVIRMASGGSVSARADGIASKGKTKGKMC